MQSTSEGKPETLPDSKGGKDAVYRGTFLKNLGRTAAFLGILALLLAVAGRVFIPKDNGREDGFQSPWASGVYAEPEGSIDVLIVGDSEARSAFIPLKLWQDHGFTCYVCGENEQQLPQIWHWIDRVSARQDLKLVLLETNAIFRTIPFNRVLTAPIHELFPVLEYHDRWKTLQWRDFYVQPEYTHFEVNKGYVPKFGVDHVVELEPGQQPPEAPSQTLPAINAWYMKRIAKLCQDRGVRLVLISSPSTYNWNPRRHAHTAKLAKQLGVSYVDMNEALDEVGIDWSLDTYDQGDHMNHDGALKTTLWLGEQLEQAGLLEDHRGDPAYAEWDADLATALEAGLEMASQD